MTSTISFTSACSFTRDETGVISIVWNNGNALNAVTGAAIDYIQPHFHMACTFDNNVPTYEPAKDLRRLMTGGLSAKLAMLVVGMRRVALSMANIQFNLAELHTVVTEDQDGVIPEADWRTIINNLAAYNGIIDQALTIAGLNGLSLLNKGHHYKPEDTMWARLTEAVGFDELIGRLGVTAYEGILFHDALHPITVETKTSWVARADSPLLGHVNGVLFKRLPGVPAGTAIVHGAIAALEQIRVLKPNTAAVFEDLLLHLQMLQELIRENPLDWCAMFQRGATQANLARITKMEPACAFVFGVASQVFERRATILKSIALKSVSTRHAAMHSLGVRYGTVLAEQVITDEQILDAIASLVPAEE